MFPCDVNIPNLWYNYTVSMKTNKMDHNLSLLIYNINFEILGNNIEDGQIQCNVLN